MSAQCCCGRFLNPFFDNFVENAINYQPLGPEGNFCGHVVAHDLKDAKKEIESLHAKLDERDREIQKQLDARQRTLDGWGQSIMAREKLVGQLDAVEAKAKTLESERDAWAVKHADALAENKLLRKIRDRAIGFRDHGESKNGTHAMFLFGALADFEKNQEAKP